MGSASATPLSLSLELVLLELLALDVAAAAEPVADAEDAPEVVAKLESMGIDVAKANTPAWFGTFMKEDVERWRNVVKQAKIATD